MEINTLAWYIIRFIFIASAVIILVDLARNYSSRRDRWKTILQILLSFAMIFLNLPYFAVHILPADWSMLNRMLFYSRAVGVILAVIASFVFMIHLKSFRFEGRQWE